MADDEARHAGEAVAVHRPLVAVHEEEDPERLVAVDDPDSHRLVDDELRVELVEVLLDLALVTPRVVVVAPEALEAAGAVVLLLEREGVGVGLQHLVVPVLPELLDVAEEVEPVAPLEVVAERRVVRALAAPEVVGAVARAAMVVAEDDQPVAVDVERPLRQVGVVVGPAQPLLHSLLVLLEIVCHG